MSYATGSIIERFIEAIRRRVREARSRSGKRPVEIGDNVRPQVKTPIREESIAQMILTAVVKIHTIFSREESIIRSLRSMGSAIQKLQCSLEDSLSVLSLLLEFLSVISIILILVLAWWS